MRKNWLSAAFVAFALALMFSGTAFADLTAQSISYLPDVTDEMTQASYWSSKQERPNAVLAKRAAIDALNQAGIDGDGTMLQPLKQAREYYFDASQQTAMRDSAKGELDSGFVGQAQDEKGNVLTADEANAIIANYPTDGAAPSIPSQYAIVTTHTTMRAFPTDRMLGLTPGDTDDDNLYLSLLRVNEPLIIRAQSVDKKFFYCVSSCINGAWVPARDVAVCKSKEQWLTAWDIPKGKELVVTGYKVRTEQTRMAPNTANRMLYMGTVLRRVDLKSPEKALEIVGSRSAFYNHVCYLPVRKADGTYARELALIAESAEVSEGYLPLTKANIAEVAFHSLGQMYGWGGMLEANDCSGYVRDVYKCFGLELARNTTWQMNLPVRKYDLSGLDDAHKAAAIAQMPLGTVLFWGGHEMIYLGQDNGKLYVISSMGGVGDLYGGAQNSYQVKSVAVNTLGLIRANHSTWLSNLTCANIPYLSNADQGAGLDDIAFYEQGITWPNEKYKHTGKAIRPNVQVPGLEKGVDYTVSFKNNTEIGIATVTVKGKGAYTGKASRTFAIVSADDGKTPIDGALIKVQGKAYTGKKIKPVPTVILGSSVLTRGTDYKVSYENNLKVGTATLTVTGKGSYCGTASKTFTISRASIAKAKVSVANKTYTGKKAKPAPVVKVGATKLKRGTDYTVSYIDNKGVGTALVKVTGKGNYAGKTFATFKIGKAAQTIKAKSKTKALKASAKTKALAKTKTVNLKKIAKVSAKTKVSYKKANKAGGKKITVDARTGKVTAKKGLKAGTYKVKVRLSAPASVSYKAAKAKTITLKVVVKA